MKISQYQQFKISIANLKQDYLMIIHFSLCFILGYLVRYIIYGFSYTLFSIYKPVYWLRDFIYLIFMYHLGKYASMYLGQFFQGCILFKINFLRQNNHIIEWETKNYHLEKKVNHYLFF